MTAASAGYSYEPLEGGAGHLEPRRCRAALGDLPFAHKTVVPNQLER
jgi:hypothetical protein